MTKKQPETENEQRFCPICGKGADSPHHVRPKSMGGTDDARNIVWLCKRCHDIVEEKQEQLGKELSPELITQMRRELHIDADIRESYIYRDGHHLLLWIKLPGKTKQVIGQYVDGIPEDIILEAEAETKIITEPETKLFVRRRKRKVGRPAKINVDTGYLEELVRKGLSLRKIKGQLENEGFKLSHEAIRKRVKQSPGYALPTKVQCKHCNELFIPDRRNQAYCSPECNRAARRHKKKPLTSNI